jgi:hypothetical protein
MDGYTLMRKIVRNDAIKSDPPEVYNWRAFALAAAVITFSLFSFRRTFNF